MGDRKERMKWFQDARFGMFIHWGLYAIPARGEWIKTIERMTTEYYQQYFDEFNPVKYEPKKWARLAKEAGQKYVVLTAKHHDGFCLFDSELTDYKATNTMAGRDLIAEYVEAVRDEGLKVGFYYSLIDWYHDDYPAYGDRHHPMRDNEEYRDKTIDFNRYLEYMHGQVRELLTNYGKIDVLWLDFSYDDMRGERWKAKELVAMCRELQPGIIINNRLGINRKDEELLGSEVDMGGDFTTPEQIIPPYDIQDKTGNSIPWEACITLNNHWGYCAADTDYKSVKQVIRGIVECVSKDGNFLLNVGPDAKGIIPEESVHILERIGRWMDRNGNSIYGCGPSQFEKPEWGRYTQNGKKLYAHIYDNAIGPINLRGLNGKIKRVRILADGSELKVLEPWNAADYTDDAFVHLGSSKLPDELNTVLEIELF